MCIDKELTESLLKNMIRTLEIAHDTYTEKPEICLDECEEYFRSYELLVQHMKGIYQRTNERGDAVRDYDALAHSVAPEGEIVANKSI